MAEKKSSLIHDALILFAITLIAALALGAVYEITKDPIAAAKVQAKEDAYRTVFPDMASTGEVNAQTVEKAAAEVLADPVYSGVSIDEVRSALDGSGKLLGYVVTVTSSEGYGGNITFTVGISSVDGDKVTVNGIEFLSISETAGLGMKAKEEKFMSQFKGVQVSQFSLAKKKIPGDVEIDAISSATFTTAAVTRAIDAGIATACRINEMGGVSGE